ncbi:S-layer homology domain-containing protein [Egbenema bharatensis]|uniref:S-layer homology domain-containing protein n=1 Tax=Egbenema bharatensis TaxID=3463334 RepID=UPI003A862693
MSSFRPLRSGTAVFSALTMLAGAATPIVVFQQAPAYAQVTFSDLSSDYWARGFIQELANRGVISGFPDGTFRPNDPVTRAQFAAMVRQAFPRSATRGPARFNDVPANYWAAEAIQAAYTTGFLSGYPDNFFRPDQNIPRAQVLVSLANGLGYGTAGAPGTTLQVYRDANGIPDWARSSIAAATERQIVVNYPDVSTLNPNRPATRAEVAAFIYQALVSAGQVAAIQSPYIVGSQVSVPPQAVQIPAGVTIPVQYTQAERIYVSAEEPEPVPVTLTVARNIVSQTNQVLIPENSRIEGEIRIVSGGARFYAREVILPDNTRRPINATSRIVRTTQEINRRTNVGVILAGAALGAGAAAGVAAVTGDRAIATEEVLGGAGLGALAGLFLGRSRVTLIAIDPAVDLDLTLEEPYVVR